jgi:hypothetical protein
MKRGPWLYLAALVGGGLIWAFVAQASGRREAWDSPLYFTVVIPAWCALAMVLAWLEPARPWRWALLPMVGQFLWMLLKQGAGNLLPLGVIVFLVFSIPSLIAARVVASIRTRPAARGEG